MAFYVIDRWKGGVSVGGYTPPCDILPTTGAFSISIPAGCTIRKAYLRAGKISAPFLVCPPITVTLNGASAFNYTFDASNQVTNSWSNGYGSTSAVHVIDITNDISPLINNYTLIVPAQTVSTTNARFASFTLVVEYENPAMDLVNYCMFLNAYNMTSTTLQYPLNFVIPIDNTVPVAVGLDTSHICNISSDAATIKVNGTTLGTTIRSTTGNGNCAGAGYLSSRGNFTYFNSTLTALANCNALQTMAGLDVLSDIKALIANQATFFTLNFDATAPPNLTNILWAMDIAYHDTLPPPFPFECEAPIVTITNVLPTSVRVNWNFVAPCFGGVTNNNVQYRLLGSPTWTVVPVSGVSFYDLTGLSTAQTYIVQIVNTQCGSPPFNTVCAPSDIIPFVPF